MSNRIEEQLARLEKIDKNKRSASDAYIQRKRQEGKQPISAILSADAYRALQDLKEVAKQAGEPCTTGDIIGEALRCFKWID